MKYLFIMFFYFICNFVCAQDTLVSEIKITKYKNIYTIEYSKDLRYEDKVILNMLMEFFCKNNNNDNNNIIKTKPKNVKPKINRI